MTEAKHTPGPWVKLFSDRVTTLDDTNGSKSIAHCYSANGYDCEANARLIAAAPDLLEACKEFCDAIQGQYGNKGILNLVPGMRLFSPYEKARTAIAKATNAAA